MHHLTELSFVDEFRCISPFHYAVLLRCVLQAGRPSLPYYCAIVLHSCIILPPVSHSPKHKYHPCQLTRQSSCVSNFYITFKVFMWLYLHEAPCKARNFNVVYIWTYVWQRWKQSLSICCTMFQHWINTESFPVSQLCVNTLLATKVTLITVGI
jgi:hypothetical protein